MGERLVVEVKRNEERVATVYYHWSAYTHPAIKIISTLYKHVFSKADNMSDRELKLALIRFAENTIPYGYAESPENKKKLLEIAMGEVEDSDSDIQPLVSELLFSHGGLCVEDREYAKLLFPGETFLSENINRSEGLVSISENTMEKHLSYAQGVITVCLNTHEVYNGMIETYNIEDYLYVTEEEHESDYIAPDDIQKSPVSLEEFSFDELATVADVIENASSSWLRYKDTIYRLIEE